MEKIARDWTSDIPSLTGESWSEVIETLLPSVTSARDKLIQFNFLHRIYYTPTCLYKMGRLDLLECHRRHAAVGGLFLYDLVVPLCWEILGGNSQVFGGQVGHPKYLLSSKMFDRRLWRGGSVRLYKDPTENSVFLLLKNPWHLNGKTLLSHPFNFGWI